MEVDVDEWRRDEVSARVDDPPGLGGDRRLHRLDAAVPDGDVQAGAPVGQGRVADEKIESSWLSLAR